ncbi:hypothetical protein LTR12_018228 [Friedmanniomyces endolithicus]|nr:hypothetical protein LTR12_018228 [Friedmanniomyces endolithicus]
MLQPNVVHPSTCDDHAVNTPDAGRYGDQLVGDPENGMHEAATYTIQLAVWSQRDPQPQTNITSPESQPTIATFTQPANVQRPALENGSGTESAQSEIMIWGQMVRRRRGFDAEHNELTRKGDVLLKNLQQLRGSKEDLRSRAAALEQQAEEVQRREAEKGQECDSVNEEVAEAAKKLNAIEEEIQEIDRDLFGK